MNIDELISLLTNVGFPAAICFILLRYMLQTMGDKLDKLDNSLNRLTKVIRELDSKSKGKYEKLDKFGDSQKEK
ncbi:YvrJ protein family protein [compost metagenome]